MSIWANSDFSIWSLHRGIRIMMDLECPLSRAEQTFSNYRRRLGAENNSPGDYDNIDGSVIDHLVRDADIFLLGAARFAENLNSVATVSASMDQRRLF